MHRQFSLQPFSRHYSHSTNPFLDFLEFQDGSDPAAGPAKITVSPLEAERLADVLRAYKDVYARQTLHTLNFVTINEYLYLLRAISKELNRAKRLALYYLAAAVSDFFLPTQKLVCFFRTCLISGYVLTCILATVRAQNSIHKRLLADRDGPGSQDSKAHG
jgi:phosphopantothenate-cysteine ligase